MYKAGFDLNFFLVFAALTVVNEADRWHRLKTWTYFSSFNLFKSIGQTAEEVFLLLVEAQPQIQFQLCLNSPACRTKALLTRQL